MQPNSNLKILPNQLNLLEVFKEPFDIRQILTKSWAIANVNKPSEVVENWISNGILVPAKAEDALSKLFQVTQLKEFLRERNLPLNGNKPDLIKRLLGYDELGMIKILADYKFFQHSSEALKMIDECRQQIRSAFEFAKQKCFELLKEGKIKDACKVFVAYQRYFNAPEYVIYPDTVHEIQCTLSATPHILSAFSPETARNLLVMAGMKKLWGEHTSILSDWLPEKLGSVVLTDEMQIAMNHIRVSASVKKEIDELKQFAKQVKISFHPGDIESCDLCLALNGRIFNVNEVPALPLEGCKSRLGCQCNINVFYEGIDDTEDDDIEEDFDDDVNEGGDKEESDVAKEDPLNTLRILKQLLDENLITADEYNQKKAEILSRL